MQDLSFRQICRFVKATHRRRDFNALTSYLAPWMLLGSIAVLPAVIVLRDLLSPLFLVSLSFLPLAVGLCLGLWVSIRPLRTIHCAKQLDDWQGWRDQLSSALCFALQTEQSEFAQISIQRALAKIREFDPARQIPLPFPGQLKAAVLLLLMALSLVGIQSSRMMQSLWNPALSGTDFSEAATEGSPVSESLSSLAPPEDRAEEPELEDTSIVVDPAEITDDLGLESLAGAPTASLPSLDAEANSQFPVNWDELRKFFRKSEKPAQPGDVAVAVFNTVTGSVDPADAVAEGIGRIGDSLPERGAETSLETRGERLELEGLVSPGATAEGSDGEPMERNEPRVEYRQTWALRSTNPTGFQLGELLSYEVTPRDLDFVRSYFELIRPALK